MDDDNLLRFSLPAVHRKNMSVAFDGARLPPDGGVLLLRDDDATAMRQCDALRRGAGLDKLSGVTLGFGAFTLFNHEFLPPSIGLRVHRFLQGLADRRVPVIHSSGSEYIVLTRKRGKVRSPPAKLA